MPIEVYKFQWRVNERFSRIDREGGGVITKSPIYSGGRKLRYSWQLEFHYNPVGSHKLCLTLVSLARASPSGNEEGEILEAETYADISFTAAGAPPTNAGKLENYAKMGAGSKLETPINLVAIVENAKRSDYTATIGHIFHCRIFINVGSKRSAVSQMKPPPSPVDSSSAVVKSLGTFLNSGDFADFEFITSTHHVIPAHKVILAARSPVFAAMFRCDMQEAKTNSVEIKDFDETIVKAMLEFVYTGKTSLATHPDYSVDLLRISDKYELLELKSEIEKFLGSTLKIENAVELLSLAFLHSCEDLKMAAIEFVNKNKKKMCESYTFKDLVSLSLYLVFM